MTRRNQTIARTMFVAATLTLILFLFAVATAWAAPWQHVQSWTQAVDQGLIEGDPAYYYNGEASLEEVGHAVITALVELDDRQWVTPNAQAVAANTPSMIDPTKFCADNMWEYISGPAAGYRPQAFADDHQRYDSITMFDDFYGPVTFLYPKLGELYQHPAGGFTQAVVCWTDHA